MTKRSRGFTLLELIVVIVMLGVLSAATVPLMVTSLDAYHNTTRTVQALDKLNYATERIVRELQGARGPVTAGASSITFSDAAGQTVQIALKDTLVQMTVGTGPTAITATLIDQVVTNTGLQFDYRNLENKKVEPGAPASAIRHVIINLTILANGREMGHTARAAIRGVLR